MEGRGKNEIKVMKLMGGKEDERKNDGRMCMWRKGQINP